MTQNQIHARALEVAGRYRKSVCELLDILQTLDSRKTYREYECTSLFQYAVKHLSLSEDVAFNFITVARKAVEVPALKEKLQSNSITISKARKICSVLTRGNQAHWLGMAAAHSTKSLECEVAKVNPKAAVAGSASFVSGDRVRLVVGVSKKFMELLSRVQDLEAQSTQKSSDREAALQAALEHYLERRDPVRRAERIAAAKIVRAGRASAAVGAGATTAAGTTDAHRPAAVRPVLRRVETSKTTLRHPLPRALENQIWIRDRGRCTNRDSQGTRCESTRWVDFHHLVPVLKGGKDTVENLTTLCRAHHQRLHRLV